MSGCVDPFGNSLYARGAASGPEDVGGLVGLNGEIASITNCYSTGRPSGDLNIGGLVGYGNPNGTVTDCYWDMTTSEIGDSAAGTGKNTDQMKQQATYENWDFDEVWCIDSNLNDGYPILRWQIPCDPCEIVETGEKYPSLGAALGAVASGQTIKLNTNITHTSPIEVNGKTINLELGNYSLLLDTSNHPDESIEYVLSVKNGGKVNLAGTGMGKFNVESSTHGYGVQVLGAGSEVTVNNVDVSWEYATAVYMYGSGDSLDGGSVTVNGNITAGYRGVTVNAKDGTVVVNGNITAGHTGVETWANPGTSVTVNGDITVTGTGASGAGVFALGQTLVTVTGNVEVQGTNCTGVHAKGGTIEVQGDVTSSGVGAKAETNYDYQDRYGQVTIHGTLSAQGPFIVIGSTEKTAADITEPTTKAGFLTYTDGNNTVWVASTGSTVPSEPQNLTATPDDGQVTLSWSAPDSNGGSAITKYQVSRDNGTSWTDVDKDILTYTFTGLTNGTPYTFLVRAVNIIGAGPAASVTATPQAVPVVTHTVNFYSDGVLHASKTVTSGDPLGANWPADPTRLGYSFAGWFTGQDGTGTQYTSASIITADVDLYAKWTQIIVSPGDDEVSIPPTPTYQADVVTESGSVTKLPVTVDRNAGTATVDAGSQDLDEEGAAITIPPIPDVDTYSVDIPVSKLSTPDLQETLTVNTDVGSITIPSNMLTGTESVDGTKAQISIGEGDKSTLPEDVRAAVGDKPLIRLTLAIDGKQTDWNNPNAPVTVSIPYTPTAEELANPEGIVAWYIDGSGNVVTIPNGRYDPETGMVTFTTTHFSNFAVAYNPVSFNDVPSDAWYHKAVSFIASRGVTSGTGDGNYSPEAKLTRGDFMVLLMRAYGIAPDTSPTDNFADAGDTYYTGYLAAAKRLGISQGVGDNMYAPGKDITRQEMFTLLYNALKVIARLPQGDSGKTLMDFSDASEIAPWAEEAMGHLVESGIVAGSEGRLNPAGTTTRAEMAQVLYNLLGK